MLKRVGLQLGFRTDPVEALMENASGNAGTLEGSVPVGDAKRAIEWDDMDDEEDWEAESFQ